MFKFSKIESGSFRYCGCTISIKDNGDIEMDQQDYIEKLSTIDIHDPSNDVLNPSDLKVLRGKIGEVLWISLMTRPIWPLR